MTMKKHALLSLSDRTGLPELAHALHGAGYVLLATSGTGKALDEAAIPWVSVESYTGLAELLDGRVKTLHPKIHGGILARRDLERHLVQMEEGGIGPIDLVAVNLYPFIKYLATERANDPEGMTELVDVGGPTMLRAAAKNHRFVVPLVDPADYSEVIVALQEADEGRDPFPMQLRRRLAAKVFAALSEYDGAIASYFGALSPGGGAASSALPESFNASFARQAELRYGENPHQKAALYRVSSAALPFIAGPSWKQLGGKELSYNNMLDFDAALRLLADLPGGRPMVAILKHLNPCGVASGRDGADAVQRAKVCDPRSHFGGVLVSSVPVDRAAAEEIRGDFAEIVIAPSFEEGALEVLRSSKSLRILEVGGSPFRGYDARTVAGGILVQEPDVAPSLASQATLASVRVPTDEEMADLDLAWRIVRHVKSNAIVLVRDGLLIGVGAGQMSRIDSVELAIRKAKMHGHLLHGSVAASDAFFPFPDSVEALGKEGITCVVSPLGARKDDEVTAAATACKISLLFATSRHFRH